MTLFLVTLKFQTFHNTVFLIAGTSYRRVRWQKSPG